MMQDRTSPEAQKSANCDRNVAPRAADIASRLDRPIVLIGLMGSGKSSTGRALSAALDLPFTDNDREIEAAAGCTIREFFERYGEPRFRETEHKMLARLVAEPPIRIISSGGGAVMNEATRALLKEKTHAVWLQADPRVLARRCSGNNDRPLLAQGDPEEILRDLLEKRQAWYQDAAAFAVRNEDGGTAHAIEAILKELDKRLPKS